MPTWHKARPGNIRNNEQLNTQLLLFPRHFLLKREIEGANQLTQALRETISPDEEVPHVNRKHA